LTSPTPETYDDRGFPVTKIFLAWGQSVGTFGERLRREREMRGIGLDEIATATKISARNLRALEDEKFNQLPGGIFNKGFVRAYAKFLGIDEEHIVAEYESASRETETAREEKLKQDFAKAEPKRSKDDQEISLEPKSQWGTIAIIVLLAVLAYSGYNVYQRKKADREQQRQQQQAQRMSPVVSPTPTAQAPVQPATVPATTAQQRAATTTTPASPATTQSSPTQTPGATANTAVTTASQKAPAETTNSNAAKTIDLKIKVTKKSWVSITADGKLILKDTLEAGTEKSVKASDKVEMVLGNAGGVEVSYNGKPVENLNKGQDVRKITFTPSGYE
jgi:cytoskeleton protein RodZ